MASFIIQGEFKEADVLKQLNDAVAAALRPASVWEKKTAEEVREDMGVCVERGIKSGALKPIEGCPRSFTWEGSPLTQTLVEMKMRK